MRMIHPVPARVIQVLRDFLPAELALIDAEEGQDATPAIADEDYWEYLRPVVTNMPAVRIDVKGIAPVGVDLAQPNLMGQRVDAYHRLEIWVDAMIEGADNDALFLQKRVITYTQGIFRVLCVLKAQLETAADPAAWATSVLPDGEIKIRGVDAAQQEGVLVRSGVVPIKVRRIETRA